jgi:23S rRNA (cytidine1920-2'-O)/16S rRNA (cytidine1409-2'-O)-methyltransferase
VRDPQLRAETVIAVARLAGDLGWHAAGVARSPLPGPSGNVEFFLWLRRMDRPALLESEISGIVTAAVESS